MMAEGVIQPRDDYVHFYYAKDHIEERLSMYYAPEDNVWYSPERLWHTFISVLNEESPDYFEGHVSQLCPQLSPEAIKLQHLNQEDLRQVWKMMEELWPLPEKPVFSNSTNAYIFCKKSLGGAQEPCVQAHIKILYDLFTMTYRYDGPPHQIPPVTQLLSLSLWIFHFYSKKNERNDRNYNSTAHIFHSDLVVTFLALKCRFCPADLKPQHIPALPKLKRSIIHHGISPEDPPFQRLILQQMLMFLNPYLIPGDLRQNNPENMALFVYWCLFSGNWLWQKKGARGILTIVKDQSRYMTLRQPNLRRNFVADKVRRELSAKAKGLEQDFQRIVPLLPEPDTLQALEFFRAIMEEAECRAIDDGSKLPPTPSRLNRNHIRLLNKLHHLLLIDICKDLLGDNCPRIGVSGWFKNVKFIEFLRNLANRVIQYAFSIPDDSTCRKEHLYPFIARIAVALQQIIAARWYVCEVEQGSKVRIEAPIKLKQHLEVVFIFLAFRSILMYFLPQNPSEYGVQRVPPNLPKYAKQMRLRLPLLFC